MICTFSGGKLNGQRIEVVNQTSIYLHTPPNTPPTWALDGEVWPARNLIEPPTEVYERMWNGTAYVFMFTKEVKR